MAWIKCFCTIYLPLFFTCIKGNVIPFDTPFDGSGLHLDEETDGDTVLLDQYLIEDTDFKGDKVCIHLDEDSNYFLRDSFTSGLRSRHGHNHLTSVKHFARHVICRDETGKKHLYRAFKSKFCHIRGQFISELVENHCAEIALCNNNEEDDITSEKSTECGKILYNWISELFDINGDKYVDHHEKYLYKDEKNDGCA